ncbi:MAG: VWA domain-containing protein [Nitrospirae bacterium]|nr:VWA domain-containing protein [Nitrospirota bacterium]MBF0565570.1 VWA domain-containing protein [Nitrospirota bacterium]
MVTERKNVQTVLMVLSLFLLSGCASQPVVPSHVAELTIHGQKAGEVNTTSADTESEYSFINNIKSPESVVIIYDASGSMKWPTKPKGEPRYKESLRSFQRYVNSIKDKHNVGLLVFGSKDPSGIFNGRVLNSQAAARSCNNDIKLVVPLEKFNKANFDSKIKFLEQKDAYKGDTPIGNAIMKAVDILNKQGGDRKRILIITDGVEECAGLVKGTVSPDEAGKKAMESGIEILVARIGFGADIDGNVVASAKKDKDSFNAIASVTVDKENGDQLFEALMLTEILSYKFNLLDSSGKKISTFSFGTPIRLDMPPYNAINSTAKVKFTATSADGIRFKKDFGLNSDFNGDTIYFGFKSADDTDPDITPDKYQLK